MLLVDDILLAPMRGLFWVFKEIHRAAREEQAEEGDRIRAQLCNLYMALETGRISEQEFTAEEKKCLDRLDSLEQEGGGREAEATEEEEATEPSPSSR